MLSRVENAVMAVMKWAIILSMAGMVVVVFLQIGTRYLFSFSLGWSEEVARLLFICIVFLGTAILARHQQHLTVTAVVDLFPKRIRHLAAAFAALVGLICCRYLVQGAWDTLLREWDQLTPALRFPMGVIYTIILLAVSLLTIWLLVVFLINLRQFRDERET